MIDVDVTFDPAKDAANVAKHGVPLAFGRRIFDDPNVIVIETTRIEDGERRFRAVGLVNAKLWTAVHAIRGSTIRFISVRRSNDGEERAYSAAG